MKHTLLALFLVVGACAKKTPPPEDTDTSGKAATKEATPKMAEAMPESVAKMIANFKRVHFELDSFKLTDESRTALEENVGIMRDNAQVKVEVQGHADERGTSEYNLALGDKRAKAVREYITKLGVEQARVAMISYGEEKPLEQGDGEIAWSKNRRVEFRVTWGTDQAVGTTD